MPNNKSIQFEPVSLSVNFTEQISFDIRASMVSQYILGASKFALKAREIEDSFNEQSITEEIKCEHNAYVVSSFMQSVGALEAEIFEILNFGHHHHLGSGHIIQEDVDFLSGIAQNIEDNSTLHKYSVVLHLLKKPPIRDTVYYQNAKLSTQVRNELVHYKSKWDSQRSVQKLIVNLKNLNFASPKFVSPNSMFFPHLFLSASSAAWAVSSANSFINKFFELLEVDSPLQPYQDRIILPKIEKNLTDK